MLENAEDRLRAKFATFRQKIADKEKELLSRVSKVEEDIITHSRTYSSDHGNGYISIGYIDKDGNFNAQSIIGRNNQQYLGTTGCGVYYGTGNLHY